MSSRTRTGRSPRPTRSRPGSTIPGIGPEHAYLAADRPGPLRAGRRRRGARRLPAACRRPRASSPPSSPAHALAWLAREAGRRPCPAVPPCSSPCRAAATRTSPRSATCCGDRRDGRPTSLEAHLRARRDAGHKLLVPYVTGGWGRTGSRRVHAVADAGADAVEIGIPFSDPMIDGPIIQEASLRALAARHDARRGARRAGPRRPGRAPVRHDVLQHRLPGRACAASPGPWPTPGWSGAIIPDLPLEESDEWCAEADDAGVATVLLVAPVARPPARAARHLRAVPGLRLRRGRHGRDRRARRPGGDGRGRGPHGAQCHRPPGVHRHRRVDPGAGRRGLCRRPTAWSWGRPSCAACSTGRAPRGWASSWPSLASRDRHRHGVAPRPPRRDHARTVTVLTCGDGADVWRRGASAPHEPPCGA